jgi:hypothetical protein
MKRLPGEQGTIWSFFGKDSDPYDLEIINSGIFLVGLKGDIEMINTTQSASNNFAPDVLSGYSSPRLW